MNTTHARIIRKTPRRLPPPGLIDIQVNGYQGIDFSAPGLTVDDVRKATLALVRKGTAAYCPTVVTSMPAVYEQNLPVLARAMREPDLRDRLLGIHIEGPFIARPACGAHRPEWLLKPDIAIFDRWQALAEGGIRILTLAPELEGAIELTRHAARQGVVVSLGHHMADAASIARAIKAGARCCTHVGNGIPNQLPRHPNPIWTQLAEDRLVGLFITDSHHLPAEFVRVAFRAKGASRCIVTSDAAPVAGLPPGEYSSLGTTVVLERTGRLSVKDGSSLAGSSATMADCMRWLKSLKVLSAADLRRVGRTNALRLLGWGSPKLR